MVAGLMFLPNVVRIKSHVCQGRAGCSGAAFTLGASRPKSTPRSYRDLHHTSIVTPITHPISPSPVSHPAAIGRSVHHPSSRRATRSPRSRAALITTAHHVPRCHHCALDSVRRLCGTGKSMRRHHRPGRRLASRTVSLNNCATQCH
jgi:hypothetical protein